MKDPKYEGAVAKPPAKRLDMEQYLEQRVTDQIDWYEAASGKAGLKATRWRRVVFLLGLAGVLIGTLGATLGAFSSAWLGVITSASAAIGSFIAAERFEFLAVSYQAAADRLAWRRSEWARLAPADRNDARRHAIVLACEEAMSSENSAWVAEWLRKSEESHAPGGGGGGRMLQPVPGAGGKAETAGGAGGSGTND